MSLLIEAASKHCDVADRIRRIADGDAVHRKIFVHGLGWDTTAATLINEFQQYGKIEDYKEVSGKSKGYGFILFKTRHGARTALKETQKKIGRKIMSNDVLPAAGDIRHIGTVQFGMERSQGT